MDDHLPGDSAGSRGLWLPVCDFKRLVDAGIVPLRVAGLDLVLMASEGHAFACERACPHEQADLAGGRVSVGRLFCPRHAVSFCLSDGAVSFGWQIRPLRLYPVRVERGEVLIDAAVLKSAGEG
ncbi:Rieske (2Fe-2S) protein [Bradyrhizobium sp. HKCCYLS1011]|uniref:Rieske (2Fe-2S) protein n=1 Tax=Bradyrhizobium sp. HKCCYLS1011 TaxID=3420733 RepID=UPI003EBB0AB3